MYYLVTQLADANNEFENPAVVHLLNRVTRRFLERPLLRHSTLEADRLIQEARQYIKGIVAHELCSLEPVQNHLDQLVQAARDPSISRLEIFTLNHDRLIEEALRRKSIPLATGFIPVSPDLHRWDRRRFVESSQKVRLTKLHGSVDWYPMRLSDLGPSCVGIAVNGDVNHARRGDGRYAEVLPDGPVMLIGTFNKMLEYTMGIHADLFCAFRSILRSLERLVVSGYSFGDKGVNSSIVNWIGEVSGRRMLIVAPNASSYRETARGAIRRLLTDCQQQLETRNERFENVDWTEIRSWANLQPS